MFGFDNISNFTHELETAFDLVREGKLKVNKQLVNLALSARDQVKSMVDASETGESVDTERSEKIIQALKALMASQLEALSQATAGRDPVNGSEHLEAGFFERNESKEDESAEATYRIRFKPHPDIFKNGTNPLLLLNELEELGTCSIAAQTFQIPTLNQIDA